MGTTGLPENPCLYATKYSTTTRQESIVLILKHLTVPRLATVQAFFKTKTDQDLLGCYAWNQAVGAGLLPILGDLEVTLRNALHRALSQHFGNVDSFDWMMPRPNPAHAIRVYGPPGHSLAVFSGALDAVRALVSDRALIYGNARVDIATH